MSAERTLNQQGTNRGRNKGFIKAQFQPGRSGNPRGRPPGARQLISNAFLNDCYESWQKSGKKALRDLARTNPHDYLRLIAEVANVIGRSATDAASSGTTFDETVLRLSAIDISVTGIRPSGEPEGSR